MARAPTSIIAASVALLAACGGGAPSAQENRQLDDAERMLDQAEDNLADIDENMLLEANQSETGEPNPPSGTDSR